MTTTTPDPTPRRTAHPATAAAGYAVAVALAGLAALHLGVRAGCRVADCGGAVDVASSMRLWPVWVVGSLWLAGKVVLAPVLGPRLVGVLAPVGPMAAMWLAPAPHRAVDAVALAAWLPAAWIGIHATARRAAWRDAPLVVGLLGTAVLAGFGAWQLDRLDWKEALLARIERRVAEAPGPLPPEPDPVADLYRPVVVDGTVAGEGIAVFGTWRGFGAGTRVVVPLDAGDAGRILVDLGAVGWEAGTDPAVALDRAPPPGTALAVEGQLDWPDPGGGAGAGEADTGLSRDVAAMAGRADARPVLVVARSVEPPTPFRPLPVGVEGIPNSHAGYAVQWFGLALVWAGMTAFLAWRIRHRSA